MTELRKDPVSERWVVVAPERLKRPTDFHSAQRAPRPDASCPFCAGREALTPPEVLAYRNGGAPDSPGWRVRVVPNKFPALQIDGSLARHTEGPFERVNGVGAHEVIIETPDHAKTLATMETREIEEVLHAFRKRISDLKRDERVRYVLIFKNHGHGSGATLEHAHSQLVALPVVPDVVREELDGAKRYRAAHRSCVFCDVIRHELGAGRRIVCEDGDVVALAPYASRFPFETWLLPQRHGSRFEQEPESVCAGVARAIKTVVQRLDAALESPPYNFVLHNAPPAEEVGDFFHWHIELMPRLARGGLESGTGLYINPVSPEEAANILRTVPV